MKELLERLVNTISLAQIALLGSCLPELESATAKMCELGTQLHALLGSCSNNPLTIDSALFNSAQAVGNRVRVFGSVLRRVRQTTAAVQNAMRAPLVYEAPPDARLQRGL